MPERKPAYPEQPSTTKTAEPITWDWLAGCQDCGQAHEYRFHNPNNPAEGGTWATGHGYRPRLSRFEIARLWAIYQAEEGS